MPESHGTITDLLQAVQDGDRAALDAILPLVYDELRVLARRHRVRWHGNPSLNTTGLVHEAYLKLVAQKRLPAESRTHFFVVASRAMRHILCNRARDRRRLKRGGGATHVELAAGQDFAAAIDMSDADTEVLAELDESLHDLEQVAERQARVVECRFFGGMSVEETAAALGISPRTVKRDWTFARAWLRRDIERRVG